MQEVGGIFERLGIWQLARNLARRLMSAAVLEVTKLLLSEALSDSLMASASEINASIWELYFQEMLLGMLHVIGYARA